MGALEPSGEQKLGSGISSGLGWGEPSLWGQAAQERFWKGVCGAAAVSFAELDSWIAG